MLYLILGYYPGTITKKCRLCKDMTPHVDNICQRCGTANQ